MSNPIMQQAAVVDAGIGGLGAAKAVARHLEKVIVFDRDDLPDLPFPCAGTPQARHAHGLLRGGHRALERLFPNIELDFIEAGAARQRSDTRYEMPGFDSFPQRDFGSDQFFRSRPALELVCRRRVEREPNVEFMPRSRVTELIASSDHGTVLAVRFENANGALGSLAADLVTDASGPAQPTLRLLETIDSATSPSSEIGTDQAYATAFFEMPNDRPDGLAQRAASADIAGQQPLGDCPARSDTHGAFHLA